MPNTNLGNRIVVIGSNGCGKTTFAKKLSLKTVLPYHELDFYSWQPGWTETSHEEFRRKVDEITQNEKWIVDGNYRKTMDLTIGRSESVVWLDYSFIKTLFRVTKRTVERIWTQEPFWHNNKQSFKMAFYPKNSIILYAAKTYKKKKKNIEEMLKSGRFKDINWIRIKNQNDEVEFWNNL